jgi:hypothetical protein
VTEHDAQWAATAYGRGLDAFNERDWSTYAEFWSPDVHFWSPAFECDGFEQVLQAYQRVVAAVPDLQITSLAFCWDEPTMTMMAEHVEAGMMTAEFVTPFGNLPPTQRNVEMRNVLAMNIDETGLAAVVREYFDLQTMLRQFGAG